MNRFITHTGRQPIWLDDINFMQDSVSGEVAKLVNGLTDNNDTVILSGIDKVVSNGYVSYTSGIIAINGELLSVDRALFNGDGDYRFAVNDIADNAGDRTLVDTGNDVECYIIRSAVITPAMVIPGKPDTRPKVDDVPRYHDLLRAKVAEEVLVNKTVQSGVNMAKIKLVRRDNTYWLSCQYKGTSPTFDIEMTDLTAMRDLCVSYDQWMGDSSSPHWLLGTYYCASGYQYQTTDGVTGTGILPVMVTTILDRSNPSVKWHLKIDVGINQSFSDQRLLSGGFSVELMRRL